MNEQPFQGLPEITPDEDAVVIREDATFIQNEGGDEHEVHDVLETASSTTEDATAGYLDRIVSLEDVELDPMDKEAIEAFTRLDAEDQDALAGIVEGTEDTLLDALTVEGKSGHAARVAALGDVFAETADSADGAMPTHTTGHLRRFLDGSLRIVRQAGTAGIVAIAAFSHADNADARSPLSDYLPVMIGIAGAHNSRAATSVERGVIRPVERQMQGEQRIQSILQQQRNLQMRYAQIDREKEELLLRAAGNSRIAGIEASVESRTQPMQIEAKYEVGKAQLKASRAQLRAAYLSKPNHSEVDQARYEAQIAQLNEREVRLDAQYRMDTVKAEVGRDVKNMRAAHGTANVYDQIERKNMEQERIMAQIQRLNLDMAKTRYSTSRDIGRDVMRGF